jgi:Nucleotidyl transferase AbiEii toxin, Type IV TA system
VKGSTVPLADEFKAQVARVALQAAGDHGFALAGGNALVAHGIISRATQDVDLFAADPGAVGAAAGLVAEALTGAGLAVTPVAETGDLGEVFYGFDQEMAEFEVSGDGHVVRLQLVRFDRSRPAVQMDVGLVLHPDDLLGSKVAAMATRAEARDYADVAAALATYDRGHLIELARRADPDLTGEEITEAMQLLDEMDDAVFTQNQFSPDQVRGIREAFASWPRSAEPQAESRGREPEAGA